MTQTPPYTTRRGATRLRGRRLDAALDTRILEASGRLLAELSYDGMSIEAVASAAGVGKAAIYRRWPGKADLVLDTVRAKGFPVEEVPDSGTLRGDLLELLDGLRRRLDDEGMAHVAGVLIAMRQHQELTSSVHEQLVSVWARGTAEIVERAVRRGEVPAPRRASLELFTQIAPSMVSLRALGLVGEVDRDFIHRLVDDVLLPVLAGGAGPTKRSTQAGRA